MFQPTRKETKVLALDVGNTTLGCAVSRDGHSWEETLLPTNKNYSVKELCLLLSSLAEKPDIIAISSVVPELKTVLMQSCKTVFGIDPTFYSSTNIPFQKILYTPPEGVGADRLVNAFATSVFYTLPAIIVDLGTASTFCLVLEGPIYAGGVISAGITTSVDALYAKASQLYPVPLEYPKSVLGKTVAESIAVGALLGHAIMVEGMVERIKMNINPEPTTILTGGWSKSLEEPHREKFSIVDPFLIYKGLWALACMSER